MSFHYRYRKQILITLSCFIVLTIIISIFTINKKQETKKTDVLLKSKKSSATKEVEKKEELVVKENNDSVIKVKVDIKGEVINPGLYELDSSKRVSDVIEMAGGLSQNANTYVINLSKKVFDEMVIIIYSNEEVNNFELTKEKEKELLKSCEKPTENSIKNDACVCQEDLDDESVSESTQNASSKININTATIEELTTLDGIGEAKAKSIIEYRQENGNFSSIEDITKVSGIGDGLFAKIKENITV